MRDEDATDASSVTEKCSPERAGQEERDQDMYKCRQRANCPRTQTDDCRKKPDEAFSFIKELQRHQRILKS